MNILDTFWQYIYKYYISGIVNDASYNPVDTVTYAIVLGICLFGVLKLLIKLKVEIDTRFIIAVTPYILAGSSLRVLEDSGLFLPPLQYLFVTPVIYFVIFAATISILSLTLVLERKGKIKDYHRVFCAAGIAWTLVNIAILLSIGEVKHLGYAIAILTLGILSTGAVYLVSRQFNFAILMDRINISILFAHLLDASSTYVGMDWLGYYEKHVVPTFFIDFAGNYTDHPALVMFPLKLLVFIPVFYLLDRGMEDEKDRKLIPLMKLVILVLGLSPAVRNTLRIMMGV
ncbi:MAG: DUF63 family protein [Candidatus Methanoperedenaceae archaeon]|nr:DUF63 family protein [Candidatus Methanoperedenaceae archaeon]